MDVEIDGEAVRRGHRLRFAQAVIRRGEEIDMASRNPAEEVHQDAAPQFWGENWG